jgi:hypothetical protein
VSRLVLKPALVLEGDDPATGYRVRYTSSSGTLEIGCQSYPLRQWKRRGAATIRERLVGTSGACANPRCTICAGLRGNNRRERTEAVRKHLPRLQRLIATIEQAEAALKKSLRAQTKRT